MPTEPKKEISECCGAEKLTSCCLCGKCEPSEDICLKCGKHFIPKKEIEEIQKNINSTPYCPHAEVEPKKEIIAICSNLKCKAEFTEWLSDSKECPECESPMLFKDLLSKNQDWIEELRQIGAGSVRFMATRQEVIEFIKSLLSRHDKEVKEKIIKMCEDEKCGANDDDSLFDREHDKLLDTIINNILK
jgi:hypothetical protein